MPLQHMQSLPLRKCGLKSILASDVRSCTPSLPLRKCGLKFTSFAFKAKIIRSLPLRKCGLKYQSYLIMMQLLPSLPLRKCGLKYRVEWRAISGNPVTSLAEVWIEISAILSKYGSKAGHFPCGSVD